MYSSKVILIVKKRICTNDFRNYLYKLILPFYPAKQILNVLNTFLKIKIFYLIFNNSYFVEGNMLEDVYRQGKVQVLLFRNEGFRNLNTPKQFLFLFQILF